MRALLPILLAVSVSAAARADGPVEGRLAVDSTFYRGQAMPVTIETLLGDAATPPGFEPLAGRTIAAAVGTDHWFLVDVGRELGDADPNRDWSLRIDFTGLDRVEVFVAAGTDLLYRAAVGDEVALGRWPLAARLPTIPLVVDGRLADRVLLHPAATGQPLVLPLTLVDARTGRADALVDQLWYGFFFGAALAFVAYTACLWLATRDVAYLVFAVYLGAFTTVILTTSGMGRLWVWSELDGFTTRFSLAATALTAAAVTLFVERFLAPERDSVRLRRLLWSWSALALLPTLALPWVPYMRVQPAIHVVALLTLLLLTAVSVRRVRQGSRPARFLLAAYAVLFTGILLELGRYNGLVPADLGGEHLMEAAVLFEALVLCVGLADAIAAIRARQRAAEARELAARERYTGRLIRAHESERRRFGAILHDDIGHGVATLRYGLSGALASNGGRGRRRNRRRRRLPRRTRPVARGLRRDPRGSEAPGARVAPAPARPARAPTGRCVPCSPPRSTRWGSPGGWTATRRGCRARSRSTCTGSRRSA